MVASLIGTLNQLKSRPTSPLLHAGGSQAMFRLTRIFPFESCQPPLLHDICTAVFLFTRSGASGFLGSLHPTF